MAHSLRAELIMTNADTRLHIRKIVATTVIAARAAANNETEGTARFLLVLIVKNILLLAEIFFEVGNEVSFV